MNPNATPENIAAAQRVMDEIQERTVEKMERDFKANLPNKQREAEINRVFESLDEIGRRTPVYSVQLQVKEAQSNGVGTAPLFELGGISPENAAQLVIFSKDPIFFRRDVVFDLTLTVRQQEEESTLKPAQSREGGATIALPEKEHLTVKAQVEETVPAVSRTELNDVVDGIEAPDDGNRDAGTLNAEFNVPDTENPENPAPEAKKGQKKKSKDE
jgi:hypothetical protein